MLARRPRRIDHNDFLVAARRIRVTLEVEREMRAEIDVPGSVPRTQLCMARRAVEEDDRHVGDT